MRIHGLERYRSRVLGNLRRKLYLVLDLDNNGEPFGSIPLVKGIVVRLLPV
jgi:hypothetical protein